MSARSRRSPRALARQTSKARKDRIGYIIIALSIGVVVLFTALSFTVFAKDRIDPRTGCILNNRPPEAHTIILIDETDALTRDDLAYTRAVIFNEYYWLPIGGRLTVRNIISNPDLAEDIVICRVDDGSGSWGIHDNPRMIRQTFQNVAGRRLEELYTALRTAPEQNASPIAEYIASTADRANFGTNVPNRRLVMISDMAQHSDLLSQYSVSRGGRIDSSLLDQVERDLAGIQTRVHYISRRELAHIQGDEHRRFWLDYFRRMGSEDVAIGHGLLIGEEPSRETWDDEH